MKQKTIFLAVISVCLLIGGCANMEISEDDISIEDVSIQKESKISPDGYTGALKAPVRCFGNHLSGKGKSSFQTDNECSGAAILKK